MPADADYSINDLARVTGLNVRTIRYWLAQGLLPASGESGPGAHYGRGHLDRLRLIKRLQGEYLPNAEIRRRLAPLSDAEVAGLVAEPAQPDPQRPTTSALDYVRGLLGGSAAVPAANAAPIAPVTAAAPDEGRMALPTRFAARMTSPQPPSAPAASAPATAPPTAPTPGEPAFVFGRITERSEAPAVEEATEVTPVPERSQWERLSLGPNIELHIRRPLSRPEQRRVERLITIARQVMDEDKA